MIGWQDHYIELTSVAVCFLAKKFSSCMENAESVSSC